MEKDTPVPLAYPEINLANHLNAILYARLGPADPREPSTEYWQQKQKVWKISEGLARTRICYNCSHYNNSKEIVDLIPQTPGGQMKPSDLPVTPKWADIEGMPSAVCTLWSITCSALRTCDNWESPVEDSNNANVWFITPEKSPEDKQMPSM